MIVIPTHENFGNFRSFMFRFIMAAKLQKETMEEFQQRLRPYNARYIEQEIFPQSHGLQFETEEDAVRFVLEWSP